MPMILDRLAEADRYTAAHPGFAEALGWLRANADGSPPAGRQVLDGERLFVIVAEDQGRGRAGARLEVHRKYIDIQYVISGREEIGWRALADCHASSGPFATERDIGFFDDPAESWLTVAAGSLAIFYPTDAHAPLAGTGPVVKAVVKVAVDW